MREGMGMGWDGIWAGENRRTTEYNVIIREMGARAIRQENNKRLHSCPSLTSLIPHLSFCFAQLGMPLPLDFLSHLIITSQICPLFAPHTVDVPL